MDVATIVRALMDRGWSQDELGERFGVSQASVSRWLTGSEPKGARFIALREFAREAGVLEPQSESAAKPAGDEFAEYVALLKRAPPELREAILVMLRHGRPPKERKAQGTETRRRTPPKRK